jgi:hypothetical protein
MVLMVAAGLSPVRLQAGRGDRLSRPTSMAEWWDNTKIANGWLTVLARGERRGSTPQVSVPFSRPESGKP